MTTVQLTAHLPSIAAPNSPATLYATARQVLARVAETIRRAQAPRRVAEYLDQLHPQLQRDLNIHTGRRRVYLFMDRDYPLGPL